MVMGRIEYEEKKWGINSIKLELKGLVLEL